MTSQTASARRRRSVNGSIGARRLTHSGFVRCACRGCGSHVHALVLKQTISGLCSTCGGCDIVRLGP